jgi:enoyl-CoA hydratase/carnithine racemase
MVEHDRPVRFFRRGPASWAQLNAPERGNACGPEMIDALRGWLRDARGDAEPRALVLTGAGSVFSLGADMRAGAEHLGDPRTLLGYVELGRALVSEIASARLPVIAAVNGRALAGGLELVLAADFAIAARSARFADAHVLHGITPGWGSSARLPRLVGVRAATYLLTTGAEVSADEFHRLGALTSVVEDAELEASVDALVASLAAVGPATLSRALRLARRSAELGFDEGLALEWETLSAQVEDAEFLAGVSRFLGR